MSLPSLDFTAIHALAHQFTCENRTTAKPTIAARALSIINVVQASHPLCSQFQSAVQNDDELASQYDSNWSAALVSPEPSSSFPLEDEDMAQTNKDTYLDRFVCFYKIRFVSCDFPMLFYSLSKVGLTVQFLGHCTDAKQFAENRYFEFLFYQMLAAVYGVLWFPSASIGDEGFVQTDESSSTLKWTSVERKCNNYYNKSAGFLSQDQMTDVNVSELTRKEFSYYYMAKWLAALAKFKESRLSEFVDDFDSLKAHLDLLQELHLQSEALIMYAIACIATKPFHALKFISDETILDLYTLYESPASEIYVVLKFLADTDFAGAKRAYSSSLISRMDSIVSYALPRRSAGSFWDYLSKIIDVKVFVLIMSVASSIPRTKLLAKLGYSDAPDSVKNGVSNYLVSSMAVLDLGDTNMGYNNKNDTFYNIPVDERTKRLQLQEQIDSVDNKVRAEAAAAQMRTLMMRKYFS